MSAASSSRTGSPGRRLELVYRAGIVLKGVDGLVELAAGLALWLVPTLPATLLAPLERTDADDRATRILIAQWAGRLDSDLASGPHLFVVTFLLAHGLVKIVLVFCLLREYPWVYPYALAVLGLFAAYQLYAVVLTPGIGLAVLMLLDLVIIWLVWREWTVLRARRISSPPPGHNR